MKWKILNITNLLVARFCFWIGAKKTLHGIIVSAGLLDDEKTELAFKRVDAAFGLIRKYSPQKFNALQRDVESILVAGIMTICGAYFHRLRMIDLYDRYLVNEQTTDADIACTLIHEAQHARLWRLGFGYDSDNWWRIEKICFTAERNFARRLPGADDLVAEAEDMIETGKSYYFSKESAANKHNEHIEALKELGAPNWLVNYLDRRAQSRLQSVKN